MTVPLSLENKGQIEILSFFNLTWAENCGISLSMFASCTDTTRWTLVAVTGLVAAAVAFWMTREQAKGDVIAKLDSEEQVILRDQAAVALA